MKKQKSKRTYRQGDVMLVRVDAIPADAKPKKPGNPILAYGEVTGHHHQVHSARAGLLEAPDAVYLDLPEVSSLIHQEHNSIELPAGQYRLVHQREYNPQELRRVAD